ncbi:hypothetical protein CH286_02370 [Rhodococcus sp. WWJCD1]|nr:hypothetical protein CH286_02370 [Rhodococcus sp. WWJCD1]
MLTTDSAQLQNLIDKDQIRKLPIRCAAAVDRKQRSSWQECFTEEARITMPFANHAGRDGLAECGHAALSPFEVTDHLYGSIQITVTAEGQASGRTNFIAACTHSRSDLNRNFDECDSYTWKFAKVDDQWLISKMDLDVTWTRGHDDTGLVGKASSAAHAPGPYPRCRHRPRSDPMGLYDYVHVSTSKTSNNGLCMAFGRNSRCRPPQACRRWTRRSARLGPRSMGAVRGNQTCRQAMRSTSPPSRVLVHSVSTIESAPWRSANEQTSSWCELGLEHGAAQRSRRPVILATHTGNIHIVLINGEFVRRDGLLTIPTEDARREVLERAAASAARIR